MNKKLSLISVRSTSFLFLIVVFAMMQFPVMKAVAETTSICYHTTDWYKNQSAFYCGPGGSNPGTDECPFGITIELSADQQSYCYNWCETKEVTWVGTAVCQYWEGTVHGLGADGALCAIISYDDLVGWPYVYSTKMVCEQVQQTCSELGGTACFLTQTCSGSWLDASNSARCCGGVCKEKLADEILTGDFNGDGSDDNLAIYQSALRWNVTLGQGNDTSTWLTGWGKGNRDYVGDFNGDGKDDVLVIWHDGIRYLWYLAVSNGAKFIPFVNVLTDYGYGYNTCVKDYDNDGSDEVIIEYEPNYCLQLNKQNKFDIQECSLTCAAANYTVTISRTDSCYPVYTEECDYAQMVIQINPPDEGISIYEWRKKDGIDQYNGQEEVVKTDLNGKIVKTCWFAEDNDTCPPLSQYKCISAGDTTYTYTPEEIFDITGVYTDEYLRVGSINGPKSNVLAFNVACEEEESTCSELGGNICLSSESCSGSWLDANDSEMCCEEDCQSQECQESWQCEEWSECDNGQQSRTCADENNCGTTTSKPDESQNCSQTCSELDGNICSDDETCSGSWIDANDSVMCCEGECSVISNPPQITTFDITQSSDELTIYIKATDDTGIQSISVDSSQQISYQCNSQTECEHTFKLDLLNPVAGNTNQQSCVAQINLFAKVALAETHGKCGDGICDDKEKQGGICPVDCKQSATTPVLTSTPKLSTGKCGDGVCDDIEKQKGICPVDCGVASHESQKKEIQTKPAKHAQDRSCLDECKKTGGSKRECFEKCGVEPPKVSKEGRKSVLQYQDIKVTSKKDLEVRDGEVFMQTKQGEKEIKVLPDAASETAIKKLKVRRATKTSIKEEDGSPIYEVEGEKEVKLFNIIPVTKTVSADIDAETGAVLDTGESWWGFMATEVEEETTVIITVTDIDGLTTTETKTCPGDCEQKEETCSELGGNICSPSQTCSDSWLDARDSERCCKGVCLLGSSCVQGWSKDIRLTYDNAISTLGPNFIHSLAVEGDNLYLVFGDSRYGSSEIFIKYSNDLGETWSEDIRLTKNNGISWVPSVAVNDYVHVIWNDNTNGIEENYYMRSPDGGKTFDDSIKLSDSISKSWSPSMVLDNNYVYIAWQEQTKNMIFTRSTDNGQSFEEPKSIVSCISQEPERPNMVIDKYGVIHMVYYFCEGDGDAYYINSEDHGVSWSDPVKILDESTSAPNGLPTIAVDEDGTLHVFMIIGTKIMVNGKWETDFRLYYLNSKNGGKEWGNQQKLSKGEEHSNKPVIVYSEITGLHAFWMKEETNNNKLLYRYSLDKGESWSDIITLVDLNQESLLNAPQVSVDNSGKVHLVFEDDKDGNREIYYKNGCGTSESENTSSFVFPGITSSFPSDADYGSVNTVGNTEKASAISSNGLELYFFGESDNGLFDIYMSQRSSINNKWGKSEQVIFTDNSDNAIDLSRTNEYGPFIAEINRKEMLFFASTGKVGTSDFYGESDLFVSLRNSDDTWGQPKNLGMKINTADDELGPTLYYDSAQNKGIILYAVGWKSNTAHNSLYPEYSDYFNREDENIWFNTFAISNDEFIFDEMQFFKYNTIGKIEDNPEISSDGKVIMYSAGGVNSETTYSDLEYYGDFDMFYSYLENNNWTKPINFGSNINTDGHDANPSLLLLNSNAYLFYSFAPAPPPYDFNLYDAYLGEYNAPISSEDIFDNLPGMVEIVTVVCGDNRCEGSETSQNCPEDCSGTQPPPEPYCGDGICGEIEQQNNVCPEDCDTNPPTGSCGDGICGPVEKEKDVCPEDCD